jgi:hypothetical protein
MGRWLAVSIVLLLSFSWLPRHAETFEAAALLKIFV